MYVSSGGSSGPFGGQAGPGHVSPHAGLRLHARGEGAGGQHARPELTHADRERFVASDRRQRPAGHAEGGQRVLELRYRATQQHRLRTERSEHRHRRRQRRPHRRRQRRPHHRHMRREPGDRPRCFPVPPPPSRVWRSPSPPYEVGARCCKALERRLAPRVRQSVSGNPRGLRRDAAGESKSTAISRWPKSTAASSLAFSADLSGSLQSPNPVTGVAFIALPTVVRVLEARSVRRCCRACAAGGRQRSALNRPSARFLEELHGRFELLVEHVRSGWAVLSPPALDRPRPARRPAWRSRRDIASIRAGAWRGPHSRESPLRVELRRGCGRWRRGGARVRPRPDCRHRRGLALIAPDWIQALTVPGTTFSALATCPTVSSSSGFDSFCGAGISRVSTPRATPPCSTSGASTTPAHQTPRSPRT